MGRGWEVVVVAGPEVHVLPHDDLAPHLTTSDCDCQPEVDGEGMVTHNSFDHRENTERIVI